jgi:hypothetical protein
MIDETVLARWYKLIKKGTAMCYIKPTRNVHDSGFRTFEVGYCTLGKDSRTKERLVLGEYSDHIWFYPRLMGENVEIEFVSLSMDLTKDGYIRLWCMEKPTLCWEYTVCLTSSAMFSTVDILTKRFKPLFSKNEKEKAK